MLSNVVLLILTIFVFINCLPDQVQREDRLTVPVYYADKSLIFEWVYYISGTNTYLDSSTLISVAHNFCLVNKLDNRECNQIFTHLSQEVASITIGEIWQKGAVAPDKQFYSQVGQDEWLYEYFAGKTSGIFVDVGAHDGVSLSNTYLLEREYNWSGLLIEPQQRHHRNLYLNRKSTVIPYCAYNQTTMMRFVQVSESDKTSDVVGGADMLSGLETTYKSGWYSWTDDLKQRFDTSRRVITVPCYHIQELLDENEIRHIDYMSIDTEGSEMDIIRAIDFSRVSISVIHVECPDYDNRVETYNFLTTLGYKCVKLGHDLGFYKS